MNLEVAPANVHDLAMAPGLAEGAQGVLGFQRQSGTGKPAAPIRQVACMVEPAHRVS